MTKLERILEGIERCPFTDNQKNRYMIAILMAADRYDGRELHRETSGAPGLDLARSFDWSKSLIGFSGCMSLFNKIVIHG
jgi:hypothetical protein